jgi:hypothetical protein
MDMDITIPSERDAGGSDPRATADVDDTSVADDGSDVGAGDAVVAVPVESEPDAAPAETRLEADPESPGRSTAGRVLVGLALLAAVALVFLFWPTGGEAPDPVGRPTVAPPAEVVTGPDRGAAAEGGASLEQGAAADGGAMPEPAEDGVADATEAEPDVVGLPEVAPRERVPARDRPQAAAAAVAATPPPPPERAPVAPPPPPERAPVTSPRPKPTPAKGTVQVSGDARTVELRGAGSTFSAGAVPAGDYEIWATFEDGGAPFRAGAVTVAAGERVDLACNAAFLRCAAR